MDNKKHWETVYETKSPNQVSWTQTIPQTSLDFIRNCKLDKSASIIDVGAGDSKLVDFLLSEGFYNITVLDISEKALLKAQERLGEQSKFVKWVVSDITKFKPQENYDLWHDRAVFHFLTEKEQIANYLTLVNQNVHSYFIIATFSENGPTKCSGLQIQQYNDTDLIKTFSKCFEPITCKSEVHTTPFDTKQHFTFCSFKKSK